MRDLWALQTFSGVPQPFLVDVDNWVLVLMGVAACLAGQFQRLVEICRIGLLQQGTGSKQAGVGGKMA